MSSAEPQGVHLVGSICLASTEECFRSCCSLLPNRLRRIPDGETGKRYYFTLFQNSVFPPEMVNGMNPNAKLDVEFTPEEVQSMVQKMPPIQTGYDDHALESYATFRQLKSDGVIPAHTRFQVCLPTPAVVMCALWMPFKAAVEPLYEAALLRALDRIQNEIPHEELAIQWDVAGDIALIEGAMPAIFKPYFEPIYEGVVERVLRLGNAVAEDVEMGFHLCYGDIAHRHFVEPKDTGLMVRLATDILEGVKRSVNWIHLPVPKDRKDLEYFQPLEKLKLNKTELYLGVVHADDEQGTLERIATARKVVSNFGVATECGMGRTPPEHFDSIMAISNAVSTPIV